MQPNITKCTRTWVLGSMIWIGCLRCEKFRRDFVAWTFPLIAPIRPVLHRISWSNEMYPNAPKHYETHQNMSLGFNDMDRVPSLRKISTRLRCTNFCIDCSSSAWFAPSFMQQRNGPKCTQTLRNTPEHGFRMQWYGSGAYVAKNCDATSLHELLHFLHQLDPICIEFCAVMKLCKCTPNITKHTRTWVWDPMVWIGCLGSEKFRSDFVARTFALIAPVRPDLHRVSCSNEMVPNATKHYETH